MKDKDRNVRIFLADILEHIDRIERFTSGITYEQFRDDEKTYFATLQCIEIRGICKTYPGIRPVPAFRYSLKGYGGYERQAGPCLLRYRSSVSLESRQ